jgi:hypothetical protein
LNDKQLFIPPTSTDQNAKALNPFTGEWQELQSEFASGLNFSYPYFYYSPDLSNVIYVSGDNYILWDSKTKEDIWKIPTLAPYLAPKWSLDGNQAAMVIRDEQVTTNSVLDELTIVTQSGEISGTYRFKPSFPGKKIIQILDFNWSPDNRHLAMSLETENENPTLVVIDTETKQATDYCVPIKKNSAMIWSPERNQIIVDSINGDDKEGSNILVIDLTKGLATQINDNITPLGWMVAP